MDVKLYCLDKIKLMSAIQWTSMVWQLCF